MRKKEKRLVWIIGIFLILIILYNSNPSLFSIFTPKSPSDITDYVNKYYFPVNTRTINSDVCTVPDITIGASFPWDSINMPKGSSYILYKNNYYKLSSSVSRKMGSCIKVEGNQIVVNGQAPFKNFLLIENNKGNLIICKNLDSNKYQYSEFQKLNKSPRINRYYIRYSLPEIEPEGKYYCDQKKGVIYRTPCGGKRKEVVEVCSLGCEITTATIDTEKVQAVKCKGEYKPNKVVCSGDGKRLYTTDTYGTLKTDTCCSCVNGKCSKTIGCTPSEKGCKLVKGDGKNTNNIFIVEDQTYSKHTQWIIEFLPTQVPYNEFTYNVYLEKYKYDCRGKVKETVKDVRIAYDGLCTYAAACGIPSNDINSAGYLTYTTPRFANIDKTFLLLHELGHIYLHYPHTCDGSIMDANGGHLNRHAYQSYQSDIIRLNLDSSQKIFRLPRGDYSCK